jgi:hypothetical protein
VSLVFFSPLVSAQAWNDDLAPLIQHLSWAESEGVLRYEVLITQDGEEVLREETVDNFLDLQLPPGKYQMTVQAFDLMDSPADVATTDFDVIFTRRPEIIRYCPQSYSLNGSEPLEFVVEGRNFKLDCQVFLFRDEGRIEDKERRIPGEQVYVVPYGQRITFTVPQSALAAGSYRIVVENPDGITSISGPISFTSRSRNPRQSKSK